MQELIAAFLERNAVVAVQLLYYALAQLLYVPAKQMMLDQHVTDALFQRPTQVTLQRQFPVLWQAKRKLSQNSAQQSA